MLGRSWVMTTMVMPRTSVEFQQQVSISADMTGSSPPVGSSQKEYVGIECDRPGQPRALFHPATKFRGIVASVAPQFYHGQLNANDLGPTFPGQLKIRWIGKATFSAR